MTTTNIIFLKGHTSWGGFPPQLLHPTECVGATGRRGSTACIEGGGTKQTEKNLALSPAQVIYTIGMVWKKMVVLTSWYTLKHVTGPCLDCRILIQQLSVRKGFRFWNNCYFSDCWKLKMWALNELTIGCWTFKQPMDLLNFKRQGPFLCLIKCSTKTKLFTRKHKGCSVTAEKLWSVLAFLGILAVDNKSHIQGMLDFRKTCFLFIQTLWIIAKSLTSVKWRKCPAFDLKKGTPAARCWG